MTKNTLHKNERLKSRKSIELLFRNGKSRFSPPYRLLYRFVDKRNLPYSYQQQSYTSVTLSEVKPKSNYSASYAVQDKNNIKMTVAVPKKMVRLAVNRNLLKRRTREIYRLKKNALENELRKKNLYVEVLFLYQTSEILDSPVLKRSIHFLLQKLELEIREMN